jgi:sirohydrochlorin cobaltochelatase
MECSPPTLMDVVNDAVEQGATRISVVPLFLTREGHVERHIQPMIDQLRERHGQIDVELRPPVGQHQLFRDMLRTIAVQWSGETDAARAGERDDRMTRQNSDREGA